MPTASNPPSLGDLHDEQIVGLLRSGAHAALLGAYFGDVAYRELSHLAKLAAIRRDERGPRVFILPGIMGSRLGYTDPDSAGLVWLQPAAISDGLLAQLALPGSPDLKVTGIMLPGYLKLKLSLEIAGFNPVFHPFDWRDDLFTLGQQLLREMERLGGPALVVAHSMGGLVARAALARDKSQHIRKLIQLGAPNAGSFAPVQALRAVYPTVRKLAALDNTHTAEELAQTVFRTLPGLYQLLPTEFLEADRWPDDSLAPDLSLLSEARKARSQLAAADERCFVIAGVQQETIVAAELLGSQLEYVVRRDGDGTVPLQSAQWAGARSWYATENHGALTNNNSVLAAVDEILRHGDTQRLPRHAPLASDTLVRRMTDNELRQEATSKVRWESLTLDSRRRILEPVISPEFRAIPPAEPAIT
ncbi:MAG TPA: alpha/beta fold hydrolase [Povalibacter sp.]